MQAAGATWVLDQGASVCRALRGQQVGVDSERAVVRLVPGVC